jgi:hypothetical protein
MMSYLLLVQTPILNQSEFKFKIAIKILYKNLETVTVVLYNFLNTCSFSRFYYNGLSPQSDIFFFNWEQLLSSNRKEKQKKGETMPLGRFWPIGIFLLLFFLPGHPVPGGERTPRGACLPSNTEHNVPFVHSLPLQLHCPSELSVLYSSRSATLDAAKFLHHCRSGDWEHGATLNADMQADLAPP